MNSGKQGKSATEAATETTPVLPLVKPVLAFEVEVNGFVTVVFAESAAKAKWIAVAGYWDAYGKNQGWPELHCRREPLFDGHPLAKQGRKCWGPDYVRGYP